MFLSFFITLLQCMLHYKCITRDVIYRFFIGMSLLSCALYEKKLQPRHRFTDASHKYNINITFFHKSYYSLLLVKHNYYSCHNQVIHGLSKVSVYFAITRGIMNWRYDLRLARAFEYNIECIHSRYIEGFKTHDFEQNTFFVLWGYSFYRFHITNIITMYFFFIGTQLEEYFGTKSISINYLNLYCNHSLQ